MTKIFINAFFGVTKVEFIAYFCKSPRLSLGPEFHRLLANTDASDSESNRLCNIVTFVLFHNAEQCLGKSAEEYGYTILLTLRIYLVKT